jgi:hypothetical protein
MEHINSLVCFRTVGRIMAVHRNHSVHNLFCLLGFFNKEALGMLETISPPPSKLR